MKNLFGFTIIFCSLLCIPWRSLAQSEKLRFEHLTIEQGLSHNYVTSVMQDRKGFLWFGTTNGLNKYDGYRFTHYKFEPYDTTSLSKNIVLTIWEDSEEMIWVGTNEGICKFDPRTEKFTRLDKSASNPHAFKFAQSFAEDKEGNIWVAGSFEGQLRRVNRKTGKFSAINYAPMLEHVPVNDNTDTTTFSLIIIFKDKSGTLWMGSSSGLHQLNLTSPRAGKPSKVNFTSYRHKPADPNSITAGGVVGIYEDHIGILWIVTQEGVLNAFNRKSGKFTSYLQDQKKPFVIHKALGTSITEDFAGNLWLGTFNGLHKLNKDRKVFTTYAHTSNDPASLSNNFVFSAIVDRSGILWIATVDGINKLDPHLKPFRLYRHDPLNPNSLSHNKVTAICEDKEGKVWVGTVGGGLNALNKKTGEFTHYRHNPEDGTSLRNDLVTAIREDRDGNLWIANGEVLSRFDYKNRKFIHHHLPHPFQKGTRNLPIYTIYEDRQGNFWLGTNNGLINFDPKSGKTVSYPYEPNHPEKISDWVVLCIQEDKEGNLWLGHGSMGLDRFNPKTGKITKYVQDAHKPGSISTNTVSSFYEDSKGNFWVGTGEAGLCRFNYATETFTTYTEKLGLAGNSVFSILEDNEGNLWLGTNNGLSKFSPAGKIFTNYDAADGLQSNLFTPIIYESAAFKGKDGTLYFGGNNGFNAFHPAAIRANTYVPPVVITQFKLFDKAIPGKQEAKKIELNYDRNFFSFEFAALNYTSPHKNQYTYQLQGVDNDWVYSGSRRLASYTNIPPGDYILQVKASNNDGIWNEQGTSIQIIIHPPWWRTWWAYLLYAFLFVFSIGAFIHYRSLSLIREKKQLEQQVKIRTEEVVQQKEEIVTQRDNLELTLSELKRTQTQLIQSEKMASLGELTAGIAHEIQNPLNFVNNFSEVSNELIKEIKDERRKTKDDRDEDLEDELLTDISQNLEKINHHGKRADAIVKGMLDHSRKSTGEKVPTDINALADEYLRLSYHGMRAKDKSFNADFVTDFDSNLPKVNVVPQDIGRVLLNIINNAFQACSKRDLPGFLSDDKENLEGLTSTPTVTLTTKNLGDKIEISVKDNGSGIPDAIKEKIFQPFFTTKPTGQGTGLGLSLSYDIVKAHGGELKMESIEGEGSTFIIQLPSHEKNS